MVHLQIDSDRATNNRRHRIPAPIAGHAGWCHSRRVVAARQADQARSGGRDGGWWVAARHANKERVATGLTLRSVALEDGRRGIRAVPRLERNDQLAASGEGVCPMRRLDSTDHNCPVKRSLKRQRESMTARQLATPEPHPRSPLGVRGDRLTAITVGQLRDWAPLWVRDWGLVRSQRRWFYRRLLSGPVHTRSRRATAPCRFRHRVPEPRLYRA